MYINSLMSVVNISIVRVHSMHYPSAQHALPSAQHALPVDNYLRRCLHG